MRVNDFDVLFDTAPVSPTREALMKSDLGFHLCGSRLLGTHTPTSDWDFVVTNAAAVWALLHGLGFEQNRKAPESSKGYDDNPTIAVLEKRDGNELVQVAIQTDSKYKMAVMGALQQCMELRELDRYLKGKPARNDLWNTLYRLAGFEK